MSVLKSRRVFSSEAFLLLQQTHVFIDSSIVFSYPEKKASDVSRDAAVLFQVRDIGEAHSTFSGEQLWCRHSSCAQELDSRIG